MQMVNETGSGVVGSFCSIKLQIKNFPRDALLVTRNRYEWNNILG